MLNKYFQYRHKIILKKLVDLLASYIYSFVMLRKLINLSSFLSILSCDGINDGSNISLLSEYRYIFSNVVNNLVNEDEFELKLDLFEFKPLIYEFS